MYDDDLQSHSDGFTLYWVWVLGFVCGFATLAVIASQCGG